MNLPQRIGLAVLVLAPFAAAVAYLSSGAPRQVAAKTRWESSTQCASCHQGVYDEWRSSHHSIAYTNPEVRALSEDFRKEECRSCHLPRPLAVTGFGELTMPRGSHFDEGVSCISCHLGPDGGIVGRNDRPEVPCQPQRNEQFLAVDACASCHNQHGTSDQFRASHYAQQGNTCSTCHMPEIERRRDDNSVRMGRKHVYEGCHDPGMLRKAGRFEVARDGDEVLLSLENVAAGHNFPTEERHRAVDIVYRFVTGERTASADAEWQRAWRFRQPYRDEQEPINPGNESGENTQLPAGRKKTLRIPVPAGATAIEARLWYRLTPFVDDGSPQSTLLFERRLEL